MRVRYETTDTTARVSFKCPGCGDTHSLNVGYGSPSWTFNLDEDLPTLSPSILATAGHYSRSHRHHECWCNYEERTGKKPPFSCYRCHSFVKAGKIHFLNDCTHALAGQTIDLSEIEP